MRGGGLIRGGTAFHAQKGWVLPTLTRTAAQYSAFPHGNLVLLSFQARGTPSRTLGESGPRGDWVIGVTGIALSYSSKKAVEVITEIKVLY